MGGNISVTLSYLLHNDEKCQLVFSSCVRKMNLGLQHFSAVREREKKPKMLKNVEGQVLRPIYAPHFSRRLMSIYMLIANLHACLHLINT